MGKTISFSPLYFNSAVRLSALPRWAFLLPLCRLISKAALCASVRAVIRHSGDIRLAGSDDGTMVSRIHAADIVSVVEASIDRPDPGMIMNVADDLPSTRYEVTIVASHLERVLAGQCVFCLVLSIALLVSYYCSYRWNCIANSDVVETLRF